MREEVAPIVAKRNGLVEGTKQLVSIAVYDGRGDQAERTKFASGKAVERSTYYFQADGSLVCESQVRSSGSVFTMVAANARSRPEKGTAWRTDRHVLKTTYDGDGIALETVSFDEIDSQVVARTREVFAYDEAGRLSETKRFSLDSGAVVGRVRYGYSAAGVPAWTEVYRGADTLERRVEYEFYTFDARGNWTRRVEVEHTAGAVRSRNAVYRTITYYDDLKRLAVKASDKSATRPRTVRDRSAIAKARSIESQGMGRPDGTFLTVRYVQLENPEKRPKPAWAVDVSDDEMPSHGEEIRTVESR